MTTHPGSKGASTLEEERMINRQQETERERERQRGRGTKKEREWK